MYTFLDFETTGLDYLNEQVIEIGAIKLNGDYEEIGRLHTMVQLTEGRELSQFITDLTGIKEEDTYFGVSEVSGLMILKEFIGNTIVVAQHASFDLSFLSKAFEPDKFICTRTMSQLLNPYESASLKALTARYGVNLEGHHRSMNDVEATIEVFKIMKEEMDGKGLPVMNALMQSTERPLNFIPLSAIVINKDNYIKQLEQEQGE